MDSNQIKVLGHYIKRKIGFKFKTREELQKFQNKQYQKHIKFVMKNSKFYRELYKGIDYNDISKLPIIDKKSMMDNFDTLNTVNLNKKECLELVLKSEEDRDFSPTLGNIIVGMSSGTSGSRGLFLVSEQEKQMWAGGILAKALPCSILKKQKIAFFLRANSNLYESVKSNHIKFEFFDLLDSIQTHIERLRSYEPTILIAPASMLILLAKEVEKGSINLNPVTIYSVAEVLEELDKKYLECVFNQKILQVYQATEGFLGITCEYGNLHLNEDIVIIEREYIDDKRFYPIITDYTRTSQPILKYRLNDLLVEKEERCKCGSILTCVEEIIGRSDDIFKLKDSKEKEVVVFPDFIRRSIIKSSEKIVSYQVVLWSEKKIDIYIEVNEEKLNLEIESKETIEISVKNSIEDLLKKFDVKEIEINFVNDIVQEKGSKLRRIISKVK